MQSALQAVQQMYNENLGGRLKKLEEPYETSFPNSQAFVVRIDGVAFSSFTSGIVKPFDVRLKDAMVAVTKDLAAKFTPCLAYHHSDEISLVYAAAMPTENDMFDDNGVRILKHVEDEAVEKVASDQSKIRKKRVVQREHMYSGRIQKLASVISSYASARLNYHLAQYDWSDRVPKVRERMMGHEAYFDGRVVPVPDLKTATECIFWRSNFDGFRNSISGIAQYHFKHSELQNKNLTQLLDMLSSKNVNVMETYGPKFLFGTWIKKEEYEVPVSELNLAPETAKHVGNQGVVVRRRFRTGSFNWADYSEEERIKFVASKYWPTGEGCPPKDMI
ncbi:tRNAHis guanylyltransferase-domain-containing protein [Obelidium mucronatum]|nr:tRNAHis guanylyltransferase-domain-containing protein [Obelidium mucronatum]